MKRLFLFLFLGLFLLSFASASLTDNLISYYEMDESSGAVIDIHAGNNGTNSGATPNVAGKINTAYDFDGATDYISLPHSVGQTALGSVSAWINVDILGGEPEIIIGEGVSFQANPYALFKVDNSGSVSYTVQGVGTQTTSAGAITTGSWYHVVYTSNGVDSSEIYVNGVASAISGTEGGWFNDVGSGDRLSIGALDRGSDYGRFDGKIDEVGFWERELTQGEITSLASSLPYNFTQVICQVLTAGNYTVVDGYLYADPSSSYLYSNVSVNYSYSSLERSVAGDVITDTGDSLAGVVDWFAIVLVISAMVVLILLTVLIIHAIKRSGLMGSA